MPQIPTVRAEKAPVKPFAALPHALRKDPALRGQDKAILLAAALLEYARGKASCYPGNRRLADDLGCCVRTVQIALAALQRAGWVRVEHTPDGRRIWLTWREADCAPSPQLSASPPMQPAAPELKKGREEERPGLGGSTHPGGGEDETPTADELAQLEAWARGSDPLLAKFGRAGLAAAGVIPEVVDPPAPEPVNHIIISDEVVPTATTPATSPRVDSPAPPTPGRPIARAVPTIAPRGPRAVLSPRGNSVAPIDGKPTKPTGCVLTIPTG